jgi:signal transduction histidine kinase
MLMNLRDLVKRIQEEPWAGEVSAKEDFWVFLADWIEDHVLSEFLGQVTGQVDEIVEIDPDLPEPEILERATRFMVDFLGARAASVRIYDPHTEQMLSYGSYPSAEDIRQTLIPLEGSIAGEVVRTRRAFLVPDILDEELYHDKEIVSRRGVQSLMAIPLEITRFYPRERDTFGVIQIYYREKGRVFKPLEIQTANLMARRLSFAIARKKIISLHRANEKKEAIVRQIFRKLGTRGGIKVKEVFDHVVPDLAEMVNLQSGALFSVSRDLRDVIIEAGYPETGGYHNVGKIYPVDKEPVFSLLLDLEEYRGDSVYEVVTPGYILVVEPQKSDLLSDDQKQFAARHNINSILYVPLHVEGEISCFMTFDALDNRLRFSEEEIDIFLFLGAELMKAQKMERLDDALHDFKNPAIATAGFARRLKQLLGDKDVEGSSERIKKYLDILVEETTRLQELALGIHRVEEEQVVNLTKVLRRRFEINKEAIREQLKQNVALKEGPFDPELNIKCHLIHVERVFDNLLNNATKAIPLKGGELAIRTYADGEWACAEIRNSGHISQDERLRILEGEGPGRGLYIIHRIMSLLRGKIEIKAGKGDTTFIVRFPRHFRKWN